MPANRNAAPVRCLTDSTGACIADHAMLAQTSLGRSYASFRGEVGTIRTIRTD